MVHVWAKGDSVSGLELEKVHTTPIILSRLPVFIVWSMIHSPMFVVVALSYSGIPPLRSISKQASVEYNYRLAAMSYNPCSTGIKAAHQRARYCTGVRA